MNVNKKFEAAKQIENGKVTKPIYEIAADRAASEFNYGDIIKISWLHSAFNIQYPERASKKEYESITFRFLTHMEYFREMLLLQHKMYLQNVRGKGYQIIHPKQQVDVSMSDYSRRIKRNTEKAMQALININPNLLEQEDIKKQDEAIGKVAALTAFSRKKLL